MVSPETTKELSLIRNLTGSHHKTSPIPSFTLPYSQTTLGTIPSHNQCYQILVEFSHRKAILSHKAPISPFSKALCDLESSLADPVHTKRNSTKRGNRRQYGLKKTLRYSPLRRNSGSTTSILDGKHSTAHLECYYSSKESYVASEEKWRDYLSILERCPQKKKERFILARHNLVVALIHQRKYTEAVEHQQQMLDDQVKLQGQNHPRTLPSISNLAVLLHSLRQYNESEALQKQALRGCEKVFGPESPKTLACMHNLALLYLSQSRDHEALQYMSQALAGHRTAFVHHHPRLLASKMGLALILQRLARCDEARTLYEESHQVLVERRGNHHPSTQACYALKQSLEKTINLARCDAEKSERAETRVANPKEVTT